MIEMELFKEGQMITVSQDAKLAAFSDTHFQFIRYDDDIIIAADDKGMVYDFFHGKAVIDKHHCVYCQCSTPHKRFIDSKRCCDCDQRASILPPVPVIAGTLKPSPDASDMVNQPPHYCNHPSGVECIQITEHMGFNIGNAMKYLWRADEKHDDGGLEDLKKAQYYVNRELAKRIK